MMPIESEKIQLLFFYAVVTVLVGQCSSVPRAPSTDITLVFANNRYRQIDTCGCSMNPVGGLERELHWKKKWQSEHPRSRWISLTAGTSFVPEFSMDLTPVQESQKRRRFVERLNQTEVFALALSTDDFGLGVQELQALQEKAQFTFLSANVRWEESGKPVFPSFAKISLGTNTLYVIGLSAQSDSRKLPKGTQWIPWEDALKQTLSQIPQNSFIAVLHGLQSAEKEALIDRYPQISFVLGGDGYGYYANQQRGTMLDSDSKNRGQVLSTMHITLRDPRFPFYNGKEAQSFSSFRPFWKRKVASTTKNTDKYKKYLEHSNDIPLIRSIDQNWVTFFSITLDKSFDAPQTTDPNSADPAP